MSNDYLGSEHGIWSEFAGGFIEAQIYSLSEAESAKAWFIVAGEDADDLTLLEICQDHRDDEHAVGNCPEQPEDDDEDDEED
jgi:hypothetical protein